MVLTFLWRVLTYLKITSIQSNQAPAKQIYMKQTGKHIQKDYHLTNQDLVDKIRISYGVCQEILIENFNIWHIVTKFIPRVLGKDQKDKRTNVCFELHAKANEDVSSISTILTSEKVQFTAMIQK